MPRHSTAGCSLLRKRDEIWRAQAPWTKQCLKTPIKSQCEALWWDSGLLDCSAWLSLHWAFTGRQHRRLLGGCPGPCHPSGQGMGTSVPPGTQGSTRHCPGTSHHSQTCPQPPARAPQTRKGSNPAGMFPFMQAQLGFSSLNSPSPMAGGQ